MNANIKKRSASAAVAGMAAVLLAVCSLFPATVLRAAERQTEIGDVIGKVLSTDIAAYVNGQPIPSMNIGGNTAIVAEDLRHYGFDVSWNPAARKVTIYNRPGKAVDPLPSASALPVGTRIGDVLYTDIRAYYRDKSIKSFNIGGRTAVLLNELQDMGSLQWDEAKRTLYFTPAKSESAGSPRMLPEPIVMRETGSKKLEGIRFGDTAITFENAEVGRIVDGNPMIAVQFFAEAFGYDAVVNADESIYSFAKGPYRFQVERGSNVAELFWGGIDAGSFELREQPLIQDGKLYLHEQSLKQLFGYDSVWDPENRTLAIACADYSIEDFGLKDRLDNRLYVLNVAAYISGHGIFPTLSASNTVDGVGQPNGGTAGGITDERDGDYPKYRIGTILYTDIGVNHMVVSLAVGSRLLFYKQFDAEETVENLKPVIDYSGPIGYGDFSKIVVESPQNALLQAVNGEAEIRGYAESKVGEQLEFVIEKRSDDGNYVELSREKKAFDGDRFDAKLKLGDDAGWYRVTLRSELRYPRGSGYIDVARFYAELK